LALFLRSSLSLLSFFFCPAEVMFVDETWLPLCDRAGNPDLFCAPTFFRLCRKGTSTPPPPTPTTTRNPLSPHTLTSLPLYPPPTLIPPSPPLPPPLRWVFLLFRTLFQRFPERCPTQREPVFSHSLQSRIGGFHLLLIFAILGFSGTAGPASLRARWFPSPVLSNFLGR